MSTITAARHVVSAPERYGSTAVAFHWIVAALVVFLGALGLLFDEIPREARPFWINVHGCVGLVYFAPVIARLAGRSTHRPPELPSGVGEFDRRTSLAAYHALYALMLLILCSVSSPISGTAAYLIMAFFS